MSDVKTNDLEYVGDLVEPEDNMAFRPAAKVGKSELDLRRIHRRSIKVQLAERSGHNLLRSRSAKQLTRTKSVSLFPRYSTKNILRDMTITPTNSAELLRAEEIEMELLNRQREIEFNIAKKFWSKLRKPIRPGKIDFKPEQFEEITDDECRNSARDLGEIVFRDSADLISREPSYFKYALPYDTQCLNRYRENKRKYEMQLRYELENLEEMQPTAYEAARFAKFLGKRALQKANYSPRTVKFTPKERRRLDYLLREEQR